MILLTTEEIENMPILFSLLAAIIPMVLYLIILWRMDKYEKEPIILLIKHFFWGAFGAVFLGILGSLILTYPINSIIYDARVQGLIAAIIVAPFVEEITKGIYLVKTVKNKNFDNITDGIIYGGAIGLGFGMTENFLYFIAFGTDIESWMSIVLIRSIFSAVMHCISTAIFGAFLSLAKFRRNRFKGLIIFSGLFISMILHSAWNASVSFPTSYFWGLLVMLFIIISFLLILKLFVNQELRVIRDGLSDEGLSSNYINILSSNKRFTYGWIEEDLRKELIDIATKLAFRKNQLKNCHDNLTEEYSMDIVNLRSRLRKFIENN